MKTRTLKSISVLSAGMLVASCTVGPDYKKPQSQVPQDGWSEPLEGGATAEQPTDLAHWWSALNDPLLDSLVDRAVKGNHDLRIAEARLREARAQRGVVGADQYPQVDAVGGYTRSLNSENSGQNFQTGERDLYQVGFDATWEIDLWGRVRRNIEAADADLGAANESRRDVLIALLAEVARNYVEVRSLQERLAIAQFNVVSQQGTVDLSRARFKAGLSSDLDVARAESQLESTRAQIPSLASQLRQTTHRLSVLTGQQPGALMKEFEETKPLPVRPAQVPVGLPSDLLRRRPDIRQAERQLAAATARIGVAKGDLFPRFSLTGSFGFEANNTGKLFDGDSRFWSIGPAMRWPIFDANRIRNNVKVQNARQEQALAAYEKSVLTGLEDVENSLVSYSREQVRRASLSDSEAAAKRAVDLATELYSKGLTDFLSVLDAQRQLYAVQDLRAQSDRTVLVNLISLYKALGGEWEQEAAAADASADKTETKKG